MYIIVNTVTFGEKKKTFFAVNDPIEGWIFTSLLSNCTKFDTHKEAKLILNQEYWDYPDTLTIEKMPS